MRCGNERERTNWQFVIVKKQIDVSFSSVCPVIDHEFRHNIVKVSSRGSTDYFDNVMTKFIINNRTEAWKTDVNLLIWRVNDWQRCVVNCQPIKTRAFFTWFICVTLNKMADASQDEHEDANRKQDSTHIIMVRVVTFYCSLQRFRKQTKQNGGASGQTGFLSLKLFYFSSTFCSSLQSSVSLFYVSATALSRPCCKWPRVRFDLTWVWHVKERICQLFEVWQLKFARVLRPLNFEIWYKLIYEEQQRYESHWNGYLNMPSIIYFLK